jgi:hypothetical protein
MSQTESVFRVPPCSLPEDGEKASLQNAVDNKLKTMDNVQGTSLNMILDHKALEL